MLYSCILSGASDRYAKQLETERKIYYNLSNSRVGEETNEPEGMEQAKTIKGTDGVRVR